MASGLFIALEGIDGAGTTTQQAGLARALRRRGYSVLATAEPSRGPIGRLIRRALQRGELLDEVGWALLFAADRRHHLQHCIRPALAHGRVVLCDRYLMSSYAYQGTALGRDFVRQINHGAPEPHATLFFDLSPAAASRRRAARGIPADCFEQAGRQRRVAAAYRRCVRGPTAMARVHIVAADRSKAEVATQALACLDTLLPELPARKRRP